VDGLDAMTKIGVGGTNHLQDAQVVAPTSHPFERGGVRQQLFFAHAAPALTEH